MTKKNLEPALVLERSETDKNVRIRPSSSSASNMHAQISQAFGEHIRNTRQYNHFLMNDSLINDSYNHGIQLANTRFREPSLTEQIIRPSPTQVILLIIFGSFIAAIALAAVAPIIAPIISGFLETLTQPSNMQRAPEILILILFFGMFGMLLKSFLDM